MSEDFPAPHEPAQGGARAPLRRQVLTGADDVVPELARLLRAAPVQVVEEVDSTNDELVRRLADPTQRPVHGTAVLAEHQRAGRGRRDRSWTSPARSSVMLSVLVRPERPGRPRTLEPDSLHWLTLLMALAGQRAIRAVAGLPALIKWPNDLLLEGAKTAGILARVAPDPQGRLCVVVGIGINVDLDRDQLPVPTATSLRAELTRVGGRGETVVDRTILAAEVIAGFRDLLERFEAVGGDPSRPLPASAVGQTSVPAPDSSLLEALRARLDTLGRRVRVQRAGQPDLTGVAQDLTADGALLVRRDDGVREEVSVGDVVHLRPAEEGRDGGGSR